jgi:predicted AAA+ superfamily ATPase
MFDRKSLQEIQDLLSWSPAVAILGARQIGKTTLAKLIAKDFHKSIYLDLENAQTLSKLQQPDFFFQAHRHQLVVLDEIQNAPELFSHLRGEIDADRQSGRFLFLGSPHSNFYSNRNH